MKKSMLTTLVMAAVLAVAPLSTVMTVQAATTNAASVSWTSTVVDNLRVVVRKATLNGQEWIALGDIHAELYLKLVNLTYHLNKNYTGTLTARGKTVSTRWGKTGGIVFVPLTSVNSLFENVNNVTTKAPTHTNVINSSNDPIAAQVQAGLLKVYATQQVWPAGLELPGIPTSTGGEFWAPNIKETPRSAWVGLSTVFPSKPSSDYAQLLGMTNVSANKPVTAGTLAKWLLSWELKARIPYSLYSKEMKYQPSQNPYILMNDYSFFYNTDFKNANSVVTSRDLQAVEKNIVDVDNCYRVLAPNQIELLKPFSMWPEYMKTGKATVQVQGLQEIDHTILTFKNNSFTVKPTVVTRPLQVVGMFYKSINSGEEGAVTASIAITKPNQTLNVVASMITPKIGHFQVSMMQGSEIALELPNAIGLNKPFELFGLGNVGFAPQYFFTFNPNGNLNSMNVEGMKDNSWPIFSTSSFS